jgi:hypothetical protein
MTRVPTIQVFDSEQYAQDLSNITDAALQHRLMG